MPPKRRRRNGNGMYIDISQQCLLCTGEDRWVTIAAIKEASIKGAGMGLEEGVAFAHKKRDEVLATEDAKEGIAAFAEKRTPLWKGR